MKFARTWRYVIWLGFPRNNRQRWGQTFAQDNFGSPLCGLFSLRVDLVNSGSNWQLLIPMTKLLLMTIYRVDLARTSSRWPTRLRSLNDGENRPVMSFTYPAVRLLRLWMCYSLINCQNDAVIVKPGIDLVVVVLQCNFICRILKEQTRTVFFCYTSSYKLNVASVYYQ